MARVISRLIYVGLGTKLYHAKIKFEVLNTIWNNISIEFQIWRCIIHPPKHNLAFTFQ